MAIEQVNSKRIIEGGLSGPVLPSARIRAKRCRMCADLMRFPRWYQDGRGFVHFDRYDRTGGPPCGFEPLC